jgi:hypothetical protein
MRNGWWSKMFPESNTFMRSQLPVALPLVAQPLFNNLGRDWACTPLECGLLGELASPYTGLCIIVCSFCFTTFCLLVFAVVEMWQCHIPTIPPSTANCKQTHWCWALNLHLNTTGIYTTFRRRHILICFGQNSKIFRRQIESTNLRTRLTTQITMEVRNRS